MRKLMDNTDYEDCLTVGKLYEVSQDSTGMYSLVDDKGDALQTMLDRFEKESVKFYRVTADFHMSAHSDLEVKEFLNVNHALREAAEQVNEFINCIPENGALDDEETDWYSYGEVFRFYGVSKSGEDIVTVRVKVVTFEDVSEEKTNRNITLHCYTDQLVNNDDGKFDKFGSAWFTVPRNWAEEMAIKQGFDSLETFLIVYSYDQTDDWLRQAINEGILIGTGTGDMREY